MQEQILTTNIDEHTYFITMDIDSCYSNIPTHEATQAINTPFEIYENTTNNTIIDKSIILELLPIILNNTYIYAEIPNPTHEPIVSHKKMTKGLPMGLPLAGTVANTFI